MGIDPAHPSFLHRFLADADLAGIGENAAGKQFRSASAGDFGYGSTLAVATFLSVLAVSLVYLRLYARESTA